MPVNLVISGVSLVLISCNWVPTSNLGLDGEAYAVAHPLVSNLKGQFRQYTIVVIPVGVGDGITGMSSKALADCN